MSALNFGVVPVLLIAHLQILLCTSLSVLVHVSATKRFVENFYDIKTTISYQGVGVANGG